MPKPSELPEPITLRQSIGPSFILLGLALGSGELIMWPYLVSQYGLGIIWGGLVGITFQYFLNTEIMRYTLAWGESVFVGWRRWGRLIPAWFVFSTVIPWALPGFVTASSAMLNHVFPILNVRYTAIFLILLTGLILSSGHTLYKTMETVQRTLLSLGVPFVAILTLYMARGTDWSALIHGLVGIGEGYRWLPEGIALGAFLGAFAYSGGGGNLNLSQSYYIKEKGMGMGKYGSGIKTLLSGLDSHRLDGRLFSLTASNLSRWRRWWRLVITEHILVFWGIGLFTILMLSLLSMTSTYGSGLPASQAGLSFFYQEARMIGLATHHLVGSLFVIVGALMLFTTQLGVLESASRIIAENILLLKYRHDEEVSASKMFYLVLWVELGFSTIFLLFGFTEPRAILTLGAILNAMAMMVAFVLILLLNRRLPSSIRPGVARQLVLLVAACFFAYFLTKIIGGL
ncbi:MAG: Nramp family divalent metal transporter [bacterium]